VIFFIFLQVQSCVVFKWTNIMASQCRRSFWRKLWGRCGVDKNFPGLWQCLYYGRSEGMDLSVVVLQFSLVALSASLEECSLNMVICCCPYVIFLEILYANLFGKPWILSVMGLHKCFNIFKFLRKYCLSYSGCISRSWYSRRLFTYRWKTRKFDFHHCLFRCI
jgi:hypothetical protein